MARRALPGNSVSPSTNGDQTKASVEALPSVTAHKIKTRKVVYLWDRRLALGVTTLVCGETSAGKSSLAVRIVSGLTVGEALPGGPPVEACDAAILTVEGHPAMEYKARLAAAGADLKRVHFPGYDVAGTLQKLVCLPSMELELTAYLRDLHIRLLVVDPIGSFLDQGMIEEHGRTARPWLQSLTNAALAADCCSMPIKHPRKGNVGSPLDQVSGSKEWVNHPRCVLLVAVHPHRDDMRVLVTLKPMMGKKAPSLVADAEERRGERIWRWKGNTDLTAGDVFAGDRDPLELAKLVEAKRLLVGLLDAEERAANYVIEVAEDDGLSLHTLRRAKFQLGITSHPKGPNEKRYHVWRKPAGGWPEGSST